MRFLIGLFLWAALVPGLSAQTARIQLQDGQVLRGQLISVTDEKIEIQVGEKIVVVAVSEVAEFSEVTPPEETEPPAGDPVATDPVTTEAPPGDPPTGQEQDPPPAPGNAAPRPDPAPVVPGPSILPGNLLSERLGWLPARYSWFIPDQTTTVFSLLVLVFIVLGGSIHFSSRVASIEFRSLGRSCLLSFVVLVAAGIQIGFVPFSPIALLSMVVGNTVLWMALTAGLFQASRFSAVTMAVVSALCMLVSFMVLEVVDTLIGMVNGGISQTWAP